MNHSSLFSYSSFDCFKVCVVATHGDFFVGYAQIYQRAFGFYRITDNGLHGVIRSTSYSNKLVPCSQVAQECNCQSVSAGNELRTHQSSFCFEEFCIDKVKFFTTYIRIRITSGRFKIEVRNHIVTECVNYFVCIKKRCFFQFCAVCCHISQSSRFDCFKIYQCYSPLLRYFSNSPSWLASKRTFN